MVKTVDAELNIEVKDDINAANMTANIRPRNTIGETFNTKNTKATLEQPLVDSQMALHFSGSEQATYQKVSKIKREKLFFDDLFYLVSEQNSGRHTRQN